MNKNSHLALIDVQLHISLCSTNLQASDAAAEGEEGSIGVIPGWHSEGVLGLHSTNPKWCPTLINITKKK